MVQEIEETLETKIENKGNALATKADIALLKKDLLNVQIDVENRFYNSVSWTVGKGILVVGFMFSIAKLFILK
jgi:hypothetical protein